MKLNDKIILNIIRSKRPTTFKVYATIMHLQTEKCPFVLLEDIIKTTKINKNIIGKSLKWLTMIDNTITIENNIKDKRKKIIRTQNKIKIYQKETSYDYKKIMKINDTAIIAFLVKYFIAKHCWLKKDNRNQYIKTILNLRPITLKKYQKITEDNPLACYVNLANYHGAVNASLVPKVLDSNYKTSLDVYYFIKKLLHNTKRHLTYTTLLWKNIFSFKKEIFKQLSFIEQSFWLQPWLLEQASRASSTSKELKQERKKERIKQERTARTAKAANTAYLFSKEKSRKFSCFACKTQNMRRDHG